MRLPAFDLDAFAVVDGGANLGAFDPGVILARWTDEDTEAWFWIWNDITNVPEIARTAGIRLPRLAHGKGELTW